MHQSILATLAPLQNDYWGVKYVGQIKPSEQAHVPAFLLFLFGQVEDAGEVSIGDTFALSHRSCGLQQYVTARLLCH